MIAIGKNLYIVESKEDYTKHYKADWGRFDNAIPHNFDENSNFPIVIKYIPSWDAHFCGDYCLVTNKEEIIKAFEENENYLKAKLNILNELKKLVLTK